MVLSVLFCTSNFFPNLYGHFNQQIVPWLYFCWSICFPFLSPSFCQNFRKQVVLYFCGSYWPSKPKQSGGAERTSWWFPFNKSKVVWLKFHSTSDLQRQPVRLKLWMPHHCVSSWGGKRQRKWKPWHCVSSRWWEIWAWVNFLFQQTSFNY